MADVGIRLTRAMYRMSQGDVVTGGRMHAAPVNDDQNLCTSDYKLVIYVEKYIKV